MNFLFYQDSILITPCLFEPAAQSPFADEFGIINEAYFHEYPNIVWDIYFGGNEET
jgi:hypothetical protein